MNPRDAYVSCIIYSKVVILLHIFFYLRLLIVLHMNMSRLNTYVDENWFYVTLCMLLLLIVGWRSFQFTFRKSCLVRYFSCQAHVLQYMSGTTLWWVHLDRSISQFFVSAFDACKYKLSDTCVHITPRDFSFNTLWDKNSLDLQAHYIQYCYIPFPDSNI